MPFPKGLTGEERGSLNLISTTLGLWFQTDKKGKNVENQLSPSIPPTLLPGLSRCETSQLHVQPLTTHVPTSVNPTVSCLHNGLCSLKL